MITRDNYESYFMDYLEGNLPENEIDQFLDFLNQNPDLKEELHRFEEVILPEEKIIFHDKQQLRKSPAEENQRFETKAIAYLEGDLENDERSAFEEYLDQNPKLQNEYRQLEKTRLIPDLSVRYWAKNKLYHKPLRTVVTNWVARAAAVLVLVWGIHSLIQTPNKPEIAENKVESVLENHSAKQAKTEKQPTAQLQEKEKREEVTQTQKARRKKQAIPEKTEEKQNLPPEKTAEEPTLLAALPAINARLDHEEHVHLAQKQTTTIPRINEAPRTMSVEEFLAIRAKKAGREGLFSAQRFARLGLNVASELSGERIGYKEKDGKITSIEFESKLMAFTIPLEKK